MPNLPNDLKKWPELFCQCHRDNAAYPSVLGEHPETVSVSDLNPAYDIQRGFVAGIGLSVVGYKAALTAEPAQQMMGIGVPVVGALFESGRLLANSPLKLDKQAILETELGFRTNVAVTNAVTADNVLGLIASWAPMIEIAAPNLAAKPNGFDLVATNSASYAYIEGTRRELEKQSLTTAILEIDQLPVRLSRSTDELHSASAGSIMGGQRQALAWLINKTLEVGYQIPAGTLLMTGAIGAPHPAKPGSYSAQFAELEIIEFSIAE